MKKIGLPIILMMILIMPVFYFAIWRPSDTQVVAAQTDITVLKASTNDIEKLLAGMTKPINLWPSTIAQLQTTANKYHKSLAAIDIAPAVSRNPTVNSVYGASRTSLQAYASRLKDLTVSLAAYVSINTACNQMMSHDPLNNAENKADFARISTGCVKSLKDSENIPDSNLNDQFLVKYRGYANKIIASLNEYFGVRDSGNKAESSKYLLKYYDAVIAMGKMNDPIEYSLSPPSSIVFSKLAGALESEKASFIR